MTIATGSTALAADLLKAHGANGYLDFASSTVLTIASGVVTNTQNFHRIAGEGGVADDLVTITAAADVTDGYVLIIRPSSDSVTITVKNGSGNIQCVGNSDIILDDDHDFAVLVYDSNLSAWMAQMGAIPGGGNSGYIFRDNGTQFVSTNIGAIKSVTLSGDVTSTSTTLADTTGFSMAIGASETWLYLFFIHFTTSSNIGMKTAIDIPASPTGMIFATLNPSDPDGLDSAVKGALTTADATGINSSATSGAAEIGHATQWAVVVNGSNAGDVKHQFALQQNAGTTTIKARSTMIGIRLA